MPARTGRGRQRKGRAFEREVILDLWTSMGLTPPWKKHARPDAGYVPPPPISDQFLLEMKNQEALNIWGALAQAQEDAEHSGKVPVVVFSRARAPIYIAMPYEAWKTLVKEKQDAKKSRGKP